jgi:hypothetical protein
MTLEPAAVVQRQLDAYNAKDIDALMQTYAADAQQFEFPTSCSRAARLRFANVF